jgi:hypothetical protein
LVFIRSRNPWVRRRLIRLGWNVRFMTADPHSFILGAGGSRGTQAGVLRAPGPWFGWAGRPGFLRPRPEFVDSSLGSAGAYRARSRRVNARPTPKCASACGAGPRPRPVLRVTLATETGVLSSQPPPLVGGERSGQAADRTRTSVSTRTWPGFVRVFVTSYYYYSISITQSE